MAGTESRLVSHVRIVTRRDSSGRVIKGGINYPPCISTGHAVSRVCLTGGLVGVGQMNVLKACFKNVLIKLYIKVYSFPPGNPLF